MMMSNLGNRDWRGRMKTLLVIIILLFVLYVVGMLYALFCISSEAEEADREIWENFKKRNKGDKPWD